MENFCNASTLEMLPDEILLEICKYLLCSDILHSFIGLNHRLTQMIAQYRHHISFRKTSITIFDKLCMNVLPQVGFQIRSLLIDHYYSLLQDRLFIKYFSENMSMIFPNLERITLIAYTHKELVTFLNTLRDLKHLVELRLYNLLPIQRLEQPKISRLLIQANNHRLTTILIDSQSTSLVFDETDCYLNILQLRLQLKTSVDLSSLFAAVPNVQYLDITIEESDPSSKETDYIISSPLIHLTNFRLQSITWIHLWTLEKLKRLLVLLPAIQCLSLILVTRDKCLANGDMILALLPTTIQQFNYAIYLLPDTTLDEHDTIVSSWPSSHPISYFFNDNFLFLHTSPWRFTYLKFPSFAGKMLSSQITSTNGYDKHVEELVLIINKNFSLSKSLTVLSQCRRVREIDIYMADDSDVLKEKQHPGTCIPKLSRVAQINFFESIPFDLNYFSIIFNAVPNLFYIQLCIDHLLKLIEDLQICSILRQRLTAITIVQNYETDRSSVKLNEKHIPIIASALPRIRSLYFNIQHLPCSTTQISSKNILEDSSIQSENQQKDEIISPLSSESMLLCLLTTFREHKLISLCVDGQFLEKIKIDTEQWLQVNTILGEQQFKGFFDNELNRLSIWM